MDLPGCGKSSLVKRRARAGPGRTRAAHLHRGHGGPDRGPALGGAGETLPGAAPRPTGCRLRWAKAPAPRRDPTGRQETPRHSPTSSSSGCTPAARRPKRSWSRAAASAQCDGGRVQCFLVLVRDDFWMAATRFMGELEVPLVADRNSGAVGPFPVRHAEKVLAAFGRAFGSLPDAPGNLARDQKLFLEQAVSGLAQDGKHVICVYGWALFAQDDEGPALDAAVAAKRGRHIGRWAPPSWKQTFSAAAGASRSPPSPSGSRSSRPEGSPCRRAFAGTNIKGQMRSRQELLDASGYANRLNDFENVIHILDAELRLITPTDERMKDERGRIKDGGETVSGSSSIQHPSSVRYYQLTHDYLVPSLRDWLTRKLRETRRGRAELRLAERTALWSGRPENRFLLSVVAEWLAPPAVHEPGCAGQPLSAAMMRRAARHHAAWAAFLSVRRLVAIVLVGSGRLRPPAASSLLQARLLEASTEDVPDIIEAMRPYRRWLDRPLREAYARAEADDDTRRQLHASLGLLPVDRGAGRLSLTSGC